MLLESVIVMRLVIGFLFPLKENMIPCGEIQVICSHSNLHYTEMLNTGICLSLLYNCYPLLF